MSEVYIWANSCRELGFKYIFPFHIGSKYERCSVLTQHIALGIIVDSNDMQFRSVHFHPFYLLSCHFRIDWDLENTWEVAGIVLVWPWRSLVTVALIVETTPMHF